MITSDSPILKTSVNVVSPIALVLAAYLFFAGHNQPGGGFAAGLVIGAVSILRIMVGLDTKAFTNEVLATGALICGLTALAPLVFGDTILDQAVWEYKLPVLEKVKFGSSLVFDLGVTLIVVGLMNAVITGLGGIVVVDRKTKEVIEQ